MTEFSQLLNLLCVPEYIATLALVIPPARRWLMKLVEDSDGDPHHTDGFFLMVIYAAVWCFRIAFIGAYYMIVKDKELLQLIATFLTFGSALLGVRVFKNKLNLNLRDITGRAAAAAPTDYTIESSRDKQIQQ